MSAQAPYDFLTQIAFNIEFLLYRLLLKCLPDDGSSQIKQALLNTWKKVLDRVILLSSRRDRLVDHQAAFA